jgi:hypothetical protein
MVTPAFNPRTAFVGFDSADNGFPTTRVVANRTGSVYERLTDLEDQDERACDRRRAARDRHHGVHHRGRADPYFRPVVDLHGRRGLHGGDAAMERRRHGRRGHDVHRGIGLARDQPPAT